MEEKSISENKKKNPAEDLYRWKKNILLAVDGYIPEDMSKSGDVKWHKASQGECRDFIVKVFGRVAEYSLDAFSTIRALREQLKAYGYDLVNDNQIMEDFLHFVVLDNKEREQYEFRHYSYGDPYKGKEHR